MPGKINKKLTSEDQINWRQQDKEFNDAYKKWRQSHKGTTGFYYVDDPNNLTYQDGVGFIKDYPQAVEAKALKGLSHYIGMTMFFIVISDIFCRYVLPYILNLLGIDISINYFTNTISGNPYIICLLNTVRIILKVVYPFLIFTLKLKLPIHVIMPIKINNMDLHKASIPISLMFWAFGFFTSNLMNNFMNAHYVSDNRISLMSNNKNSLFLYFIVVVIIMPIISEIGVRCAGIQLLRQFGDTFAIIVISFLNAFLYCDIAYFSYTLITSIAVSYFMLRTGSVITSITMRITINLVAYTNEYLRLTLQPELYRIIILSCCITFILLGLITVAVYLNYHTDKINMKVNSQFLAFNEKLTIMLTGKSVIISFCIIFVATIMNLNIRI